MKLERRCKVCRRPKLSHTVRNGEADLCQMVVDEVWIGLAQTNYIEATDEEDPEIRKQPLPSIYPERLYKAA
jgi:hypothetical protein